MSIYRIQWCWQGLTGSPEDRYCNTLHFSKLVDVDFTAGATPLGGAILGALVSDPDAFYRVWGPAGLAGHAVGIGSTFKIYNLADPEPRSPVYSFVYPSPPGVTPSTGDPLPSEVAVCLSYEAIAVAGTNRARRRGRIYLGPLTTEVLEGGSGGSYVGGAFASAVITAWGGFVGSMEALDCPVGVYSPTDELFLPAQTAWVDNAFDTQRRRGLAPNYRETWTHP